MNTPITVAAAAIAASLSPALHAQSAVTLFGTMDAAVQVVRGEGNGSVRRLGSGAYAPSRIGFRGSEDLGGGSTASFHLEAAVSADTGLGSASNSNNQPSGAGAPAAGGQALTFNRRSTVSLAGRWGELRLGRDYVPSFLSLAYFDPFGAVGSGAAANLQIGAGQGSIGQSTLVTAVRASNSVAYFLPSGLGGLYGQAMFAMGENPSGGSNARDGRHVGARLGWANETIDVVLSAGDSKFSPASAIGGDYRAANASVSYRLPVGRLMAQVFHDRVDTPVPARRQTGWLLGGVFPVGAGEIRASVVNSNVSGTANDARLVALGYAYHLSKRTTLYTTIAQVDNRGSGVLYFNGRAATTPGGSTRGLDMGVRHGF
jgi:predicted porin